MIKRIKIHPNKIKENDEIEAEFPDGSVERGLAVKEVPDIGESARLFLLENATAETMAVPQAWGHILTDGAGFPEGTIFYKIER